jgi:hypothetical protein
MKAGISTEFLKDNWHITEKLRKGKWKHLIEKLKKNQRTQNETKLEFIYSMEEKYKIDVLSAIIPIT